MKKILFIFVLYSTSLMANVHIFNEESKLPDDAKELYIDLIKKVIANTIYEDNSVYGQFNSDIRQDGKDWPLVAHTMIGMKRLNNIQDCLKSIIENKIPGDCIETGVWRGGATILMRAILKAYNERDRMVWVADSFEGLPPPNPEQYPADLGLNLNEYPFLAVSLENVQRNFAQYGLLDKQVVFLKGYFRDTLPTAPIDKIALLRLDGDLYESTMDALVNLYPKLSIGGFIIIDDLCIPACGKAVADYREAHEINDPIQIIDWTGIFWQKTK